MSNVNNLNIQREGHTTGRWASYHLIVNGVKLGIVKRASWGGGGVLMPRTRQSAWRVQGLIGSQQEVEQFLIDSAIQFGKLEVA